MVDLAVEPYADPNEHEEEEYGEPYDDVEHDLVLLAEVDIEPVVDQEAEALRLLVAQEHRVIDDHDGVAHLAVYVLVVYDREVVAGDGVGAGPAAASVRQVLHAVAQAVLVAGRAGDAAVADRRVQRHRRDVAVVLVQRLVVARRKRQEVERVPQRRLAQADVQARRDCGVRVLGTRNRLLGEHHHQVRPEGHIVVLRGVQQRYALGEAVGCVDRNHEQAYN